jgi:hypothetical protein
MSENSRVKKSKNFLLYKSYKKTRRVGYSVQVLELQKLTRFLALGDTYLRTMGKSP